MKKETVLSVQASSGGYSIVLGWNVFSRMEVYLKRLRIRGKVGVVSNRKIGSLYFSFIRKGLKSIGVEPHFFYLPEGERYKNLKTVEGLYSRLINQKFDRSSYLFALGGGVIGDMVGYTAATYLRGIPLIQIPTSLVAQVDSSIGGKTGVDHPKGKNLIGAFYPPRMILTDLSTLGTLPKREFVGGLAEVVKYGVIYDRPFFNFIKARGAQIRSFHQESIFRLVKRSCEIKTLVVSRDEKESGLRRILNYGHTLGHALETVTRYKKFKHGEAISIGMEFAARLSAYLGYCPVDLVSDQGEVLKGLGLPRRLPNVSLERLLNIMTLDKKVQGGRVHFVLPTRIGKVSVEPVEKKHILKVLKDHASEKSN